ncbi:MAG TPA: hypothetical protein VF407_01890 [Polyangiaceae bacterium]
MRSMIAAALAVLCPALLLGACAHESVHSTLTLNGSGYGPDHCKNLAASSLYGVELLDEHDVAVRIAQDIDDSVTVVVVDGVHAPQKLEHCASVHFDQDLHNGGSYDLSGHATIDCTGTDVSVKGIADFDDCEYEY